ncbi:hypothetical protein SAMN05444404_3183 [Ruegeria lacuscaerulensis ITI-1157]|nr:hypothetical protein SAMN05444404_3183 [Ruegeria lacuscaerulensis ITI-1157]
MLCYVPLTAGAERADILVYQCAIQVPVLLFQPQQDSYGYFSVTNDSRSALHFITAFV